MRKQNLKAIEHATLRHKDSDERFAVVLRAAKAKNEASSAPTNRTLVAKLPPDGILRCIKRQRVALARSISC